MEEVILDINHFLNNYNIYLSNDPAEFFIEFWATSVVYFVPIWIIFIHPYLYIFTSVVDFKEFESGKTKPWLESCFISSVLIAIYPATIVILLIYGVNKIFTKAKKECKN